MAKQRAGRQRPGNKRVPYRGPGRARPATLGVDVGGVIVALERRDKAPICERLGITHFVDDRLDVLAYMETVEHRYLLGPPPATGLPDWAVPATTWPELAALIRGTG